MKHKCIGCISAAPVDDFPSPVSSGPALPSSAVPLIDLGTVFLVLVTAPCFADGLGHPSPTCAGHWDLDTMEVEILFASVDLVKFSLLGNSGFFLGESNTLLCHYSNVSPSQNISPPPLL